MKLTERDQTTLQWVREEMGDGIDIVGERFLMYLYPNENLDLWTPKLEEENGIKSRLVTHLAMRHDGIDVILPVGVILNLPKGENVSNEGSLYWGLTVNPEGYKMTVDRSAVESLFAVAKEEYLKKKKSIDCKDE